MLVLRFECLPLVNKLALMGLLHLHAMKIAKVDSEEDCLGLIGLIEPARLEFQQGCLESIDQPQEKKIELSLTYFLTANAWTALASPKPMLSTTL
jgi:hypothetical protein